jgi:hypothetical protein
VNTNHIYGEYGIYCCLDNLKPEFDFEGIPYAANHFRAVLDILYYYAHINHTSNVIYGAAQDFFDTPEQEEELFTMAEKMGAFLSPTQQIILEKWFDFERYGNRKYVG